MIDRARTCGECEALQRTGTGCVSVGDARCVCACHVRGDGIAVPMPAYFTPLTCGVPALDGWDRCARAEGHSGAHESGDGSTRWVSNHSLDLECGR
jgi:hypothetical protein